MKHFKYLRYLIVHKFWVLAAGVYVGAPLWRLLIHDWTKFLPDEWFPYAEWFYGRRPHHALVDMHRDAVSPQRFAFERAHHRHILRNKHHWNFWVFAQEGPYFEAIEMPEKYVREMVADWMGAGRAISGEWRFMKWWAEHRNSIQLHPVTRMFVVQLLEQQAARLNLCATSVG